MQGIINIGYDNYVNTDKIIVILNKETKPIKEYIQKLRQINKVIDATQGKATKTVIICNDDNVYISALPPSSIAKKSGIFKLIGYDCYVNINKVSSITQISSNPIKKYISHYEDIDMVLNATYGRQRRSAIITSDGFVILTAKTTRTLAENLESTISDAFKEKEK